MLGAELPFSKSSYPVFDYEFGVAGVNAGYVRCQVPIVLKLESLLTRLVHAGCVVCSGGVSAEFSLHTPLSILSNVGFHRNAEQEVMRVFERKQKKGPKYCTLGKVCL